MGRDFYAILDINKNATEDEIKKAYKKQALRWHPDKNTSNQEEAQKRFQDIGEAYTVLSEPNKRAVYDRVGEDGMQADIDGSNACSSHFGGMSPNNIFQQFFGTTNHMGGGSFFINRTTRTNLPCTLEQLYNGHTKRLRISRKIYKGNRGLDGVENDSKVIEIKIRPGWKAGTAILFEGAGDILPGQTQGGDIQMIIKEIQHTHYKRYGNDLVYTANISLKDALLGRPVDIKTLDNRTITVTFNKVINPGYKQLVKDEGMPIINNPTQKGNLYVVFEVEFPKTLTQHQKHIVNQL